MEAEQTEVIEKATKDLIEKLNMCNEEKSIRLQVMQLSLLCEVRDLLNRQIDTIQKWGPKL